MKFVVVCYCEETDQTIPLASFPTLKEAIDLAVRLRASIPFRDFWVVERANES
jgi:hypothetical protein